MMKKGFISLFSIGILLICWQLTALFVNLPALFPSVPCLVKTLAGLITSETFYQSVAATLLRGIAGMFLSFTAAIGVAYIFSRSELIYELFRPLLAIMRSVPVISFILLALIFLNPESIPLIIAFLTMFPLLVENLTKGIRCQRKELMLMARQFRIGFYNRLTQVIYPQLKPFLYSGLASASGFGWRAIIMGEVLAQCTLGIGGEMKRAQTFIAVPELMAWTIIAILISFLFDKGISWLGKQSFPVRYSSREKVPAHMEGADIRITDLSFHYGKSNIFSHYSYTFQKGLIYGIMAPSGNGKTTLLNLIGGILQPTCGKIKTGQTYGIASVFQKPELLDQLTLLENIAFSLAGLTHKKNAIQTAAKLLEYMELTELSERYPRDLSYGQQQRIAIARALAFPSSLLLMDEPFKGLDEALNNRIITCIREHQSRSGQTIIFTTHNPEELKRMAAKIVKLDAD